MNSDPVEALAKSQGSVVTAQQCYQLGLSYRDIRSRCDSGQWSRLCRGTYLVNANLDGINPRERQLRSALLALGADAVAVLQTVARLWHIDGVPPNSELPHVSRPRASRRSHRPGVRVHHFALPHDHVTVFNGMAVTNPVRTVANLMCKLSRAEAIALADSALNRQLISPLELRNMLRALPRRPGRTAALKWLDLVDGRAESPLETRVRLDCADHGVAPDELQYPIIGADNRLLGYADMAWKGHRVVAEADGAAPHSEPVPLFRDRQRQNRFVLAGWTVLRFTWRDIQQPGAVASVVRRALDIAA